jgi:hypothetical protein
MPSKVVLVHKGALGHTRKPKNLTMVSTLSYMDQLKLWRAAH